MACEAIKKVVGLVVPAYDSSVVRVDNLFDVRTDLYSPARVYKGSHSLY